MFKTLLANPAVQLALCYVGVVGSLLVYGVLQVGARALVDARNGS